MIGSIAVVGGGLAGVTVVQTLRADGFDGRLVLIGEEPDAAYDRPSLSKSVLAGEVEQPPQLMPAAWFDDARIESRPSTRVARIDAVAGALHLAKGAALKVDRVVIATGARARVPDWPGVDLPCVYRLRTLADVRVLQEASRRVRRIAIIGGGLIGCEVATTARKLGLDVVLIESADALLQRVLGRTVGQWCHSELARLGVDIRLGVSVRGIRPDAAGAVIDCADGTVIEADGVLLCIGADPADELARAAGLVCSRGIEVDASGQSSVPGIFAAGDVASWPLVGGGRRSLETYLNSQSQAIAVAKALLGHRQDVPQEPLSWTEIAGHRIQIVGDIRDAGHCVRRGTLDDGSALLFRLEEGAVVAALALNAAKDFSIATRLVSARARLRPEQLQDSSQSLRELLRTANKGDKA